MRILHTSDWHLGRTFHGMLLDDAHAAFADHLLEVVADQAIDAVLVSGDVYDRAVPPNASVALLDATLQRLSERTRVVLTPGNHDSARRLGFASELLREGLVIQARVGGVDHGIELPDAEGRVGAVAHALPYLDPDAARESLPPLLAHRLGEQVGEQEEEPSARPEDDQSEDDPAASEGEAAGAEPEEPGTPPAPQRLPRSHKAVVSGALRLVAADLERRRRGAAERVPSLLMAHAFVVGGHASDSERDIRVGGVDSVPSEVFATLGGSPHAEASGGLDYVALGHLHRPQEIRLPEAPDSGSGGRRPRLAYSGSPLAFSFEEADQAKSCVVVELGAQGITGLERIEVPVRHPVRTLTGTMDELLSPAHDDAVGAWVRVVLTGERPAGALATLKRRFPTLLAFSHDTPVTHGHERITITRAADPVEVTAQFLEAVGSRPPGRDERAVLAAVHAQILAPERSA